MGWYETLQQALDELERQESLATGRATSGMATHPEVIPALDDLAVMFDVPGVGEIWLVPDEQAAHQLQLPAGSWVTSQELMLLELLDLHYRREILRWMKLHRARLTEVRLRDGTVRRLA